MPEFNYARGRIEESLQFITGEIKEFESEYAGKKFNDYQIDISIFAGRQYRHTLIIKKLC